jgi:two-component system cell cycle response regulator DivK
MNPQKPFGLIVEDDPDLSDIFSEAVKAAGFETEIILNGRLAMERLRLVVPQLVILDMHLPEVSGKDILAYIHSDERLKKTVVVVATADALMGEQMRDQADFVLIKPITFAQLRDMSARLKPAV